MNIEELIIGKELISNTTYEATSKIINVYPDQLKHFGLPENTAYGGGGNQKVAFYLANLENVTLDFKGAKLFLHSKIQPFLIMKCKNITIKNVEVEYERPPFSEGKVMEVGDNYFIGRFNDNCPYHVVDNNIVFYGPDWENNKLKDVDLMFFQGWDSITKKGKGLFLSSLGKVQPPSNRPDYRIHLVPTDLGNQVVRFDGYNIVGFFKSGDTFVIGHEDRTLSSVFAALSENLVIENYRIVNGQGMGILPSHVKNVTLDGLYIGNKDENYAVGNSADGIHAFSCSGEFKILNSEIRGTIDDGLNIHSHFFHVLSVDGNKIIVENRGQQGTNTFSFAEGDEIQIYKGSTLEPKGRYLIKQFKVLDFKHEEYILDRNANGILSGDMIENISCQPNITVRNTKFIRANTHLRLQSRGNILFENCDIEYQILLSGDATYWFESSPCTNVLIKNCRFTTPIGCVISTPEVVPCEYEPYYHKNIRIEDCTFESDLPLNLVLTDNISFINCKNVYEKKISVKLHCCGEFNSNIDVETVRLGDLKIWG